MKACVAFLSVFVLLQTVSHAVVDLGQSVAATPYDPYLRPVESVLRGNTAPAPTLERARELMKVAHGFRYEFDEPYVPADPAVTAKRQAGDCKDKSLWLCKKLGDKSIRFVVGKAERNSSMSHAWLLWKKDGRWWILDPTNASEPIAADNVGRNDYLPIYSYARGAKFKHGSSARGRQSESRPVAVAGR